MNTAFWLAAWIGASLPWRSSAVLGIAGRWPKKFLDKPFWLTVLESLLLYNLVYASMFFLETQRGELAKQTWQFWVIALCLWVVLAFPAAAWFKLRKP